MPPNSFKSDESFLKKLAVGAAGTKATMQRLHDLGFQPKVAPYYRAEYGAAYVGDSRELLEGLASASVDLVMTSPPFALRRKKTYGNVDETEYVDWLIPFAQGVHRVLKDTGSFVLDLGGAYRAGVPSPT